MTPTIDGIIGHRAAGARFPVRSPCASIAVVIVRACAAVALGFAAISACAQETPEEAVPIRFEGYANAPQVTVVPRKDELFFYPCDQCHADMEADPEIRKLDTPHHAEIQHGRGRIWCLSCHDLENRNNLVTLLDEPVDFDEAHVVCGGCHASQHKDWVFGAHGKRVASWRGERVQYNCTQCHDAHDPAIAPRAPEPPPRARAGLELEPGKIHQAAPIWADEDNGAQHE